MAKTYITEICKKANKHLDVMFRMKRLLPRICLEKLYKTIVRPILDYGDVLYDNCLNYESEFLEKVQRRAAILSTGAFKITKHKDLLNSWDYLHYIFGGKSIGLLYSTK